MSITERRAHPLAVAALILYAAVMLAPVAWMILTSFKQPADTTAAVPSFIPAPGTQPAGSVFFQPSFENYTRQIASPTFGRALLNSTLVAVISTLASVGLGAFAAYGFSRFRFAGSNDWQFFILSTRMLPAMAVSVPIAWMYQQLGLRDTHLGLIILYTCFNLSFSTWMMKAFIDEIPTAYEEAALLDGYSRLQVLFKIILPQASTGIMATAVFCLIAAWNEYAFALTLTTMRANTVPVEIAGVAQDANVVYGRLAAAALLFMLPIVVFTLLMRKHLLRGITFGAVKG